MNKQCLIGFIMLTTAGAFCVPAAAESTTEATTEADAVSSASEYDFLTNYMKTEPMTGDALMDAINEQGGYTTVSTVDTEGNVTCAYFGYTMAKRGEDYYIVLSLRNNTTSQNLKNGSSVVAVYAVPVAPEEGESVAPMNGANMRCELVTDEKLIADIAKDHPAFGDDTIYLLKVVEFRPLG